MRIPEFSALVGVYCVCVPEQLAVRSLLQSPLPPVPSASVTCPFPAPGAASLEKHSEQTEQSSWEPKVSYFSAAQTSPLFLNPLTTSSSVFLLLLLRIPTSSSMTGAMTRNVYNQPCHFTLKPSAPSHRSEQCLGFFCASLTSSVLGLGWSSHMSSSNVLDVSLLLILDSQFASLCVNFLSTWHKLECFEKVEPLLRKVTSSE